MLGGDGMSPDTRLLPYLVLPTVSSTLFLWGKVQLTRSFGKPAVCLAPAGLLLQIRVLPLLRAAFPATSWPGCVLISLGPGRTVFRFMFPLDCIFREHQSSNGVSAVYFVVKPPLTPTQNQNQNQRACQEITEYDSDGMCLVFWGLGISASTRGRRTHPWSGNEELACCVKHPKKNQWWSCKFCSVFTPCRLLGETITTSWCSVLIAKGKPFSLTF